MKYNFNQSYEMHALTKLNDSLIEINVQINLLTIN